MNVVQLYAELQKNPKSVVLYRQLMDYYKSINQTNESEAFQELIQKQFYDNNTDIDSQ